jgi:hypothetical protein
MQKQIFYHLSFVLLFCALPLLAPAQIVVGEAPAESGTTVVVRPAPREAIISGLTEICKGGETILKVEGDFESFQWNTGSEARYIRVHEEGKYEVTVKTKAGCTFVSSVNVRIKPCT